jgi:L-asparagine oxygenase
LIFCQVLTAKPFLIFVLIGWHLEIGSRRRHNTSMNGGARSTSSWSDLANTVTLTPVERAELDALANDMISAVPQETDNVGWVRIAQNLSCDLPRRLRIVLRQYRRDSGCDGRLLLHGLPVHEQGLPATPMTAESVQRAVSHPASMLALVSLQLGEIVAYREEKKGALVQDVVPVPGMESMQGNAGSDDLAFHVENAFHDNRPDFVSLLCLRADHDGVAGLRIAAYRKAVHLLPERTRRILRECRFATTAPPSFGAGAITPHAVLEGGVDDPNLRVDFTSTRPADSEAMRSLVELRKALVGVQETLILGPGDLAIVDNRITVHGRTAFLPHYDGRDRWLQRVYVQVDFRRSREFRPGDGHVVHSQPPV